MGWVIHGLSEVERGVPMLVVKHKQQVLDCSRAPCHSCLRCATGCHRFLLLSAFIASGSYLFDAYQEVVDDLEDQLEDPLQIYPHPPLVGVVMPTPKSLAVLESSEDITGMVKGEVKPSSPPHS